MAVLLGISGAAGRMGRRLIALAAEKPESFRVAAAIDIPGSPEIGRDAGEMAGGKAIDIRMAAELSGDPEVLIDFSAPAATRGLIGECVKRKIAMLIGTTGLTAADQPLIDDAAKSIAILQATNTSLGVNVLFAVAADIARQLGADYDIEIVEAHHNQKKDAPSGTAFSLAENIARATGRQMKRDLVHGRHGQDALRKKGTIGMHAVRMGDVVGDHTVYFAGQGERIELRHTASNRDTFARGALRAAAFLAEVRRVGKTGRFTMADVLGL